MKVWWKVWLDELKKELAMGILLVVRQTEVYENYK